MWPDIPYVTDREAYAIARAVQPEYPDIARRIRRCVWRRRLIGAASILLVGVGLWLVLVGATQIGLRSGGAW